jgi:hypothetical protein
MSAKDGIFKEIARAGLAALAGMMLLAVPAASATAPAKTAKVEQPATRITTPAQRCAALEKQFDDAAKTEADGKNLASAKKLRAEGGHLCEVGRHAAGALRLSRALAEIGLKAKEP